MDKPCRLAIGGGCRTGKTTLSKRVAADWGVEPWHTDDIIRHGGPTNVDRWGIFVAPWFDRPGPWIIEGVRVAPALRRRMDSMDPPNVDAVIWLCEPLVELTPEQARLNTALDNAKASVADWLAEQSVLVLNRANCKEIERVGVFRSLEAPAVDQPPPTKKTGAG